MGGVNGKTKEVANEHTTSLLDHMLSWSVDDIFDESLFKQKVKMIPKAFNSITEYFDAFKLPLLEEMRAHLCSKLLTVSNNPYAAVISVHQQSDPVSQFYHIKVDKWLSSYAAQRKEPYNVSAGDMFVLMESKPDVVHDLRTVRQKYVLASAVELVQDDGSSFISLRLKSSQEADYLNRNGGFPFVVFLMNVTSFERVWNALHNHENLKIVENVLQSDPGYDRRAGGCKCSEAEYGLIRKVPSILSTMRLNESQSAAVVASISKIRCEHKSSTSLICAPPGTGKALTISSMLCILLKEKYRTLVCSPTTVGVRVVASHFAELLRSSSGKLCSVGNVLLFGSKEQLKVGPGIEDLCLDYRVKRLEECFNETSGWRCSFHSLLCFLEDSGSRLNMTVDGELIESNGQCNFSLEYIKRIWSSLQYVRYHFNAYVVPVRRCISILCTHIAKDFISEHNYQNLIVLFDSLISFENVLFGDAAELLKLPAQCVTGESFLDTIRVLEKKRKNCISLLRLLYFSIADCHFPQETTKNSLEDFCYRMSSLLLCTASSSAMLYSLRVGKIDVLVINDAAHMKECESTITLQLPAVRHCVLFGDEQQLPGLVVSQLSDSLGFGRSLFWRLSHLRWPRCLLNTQYRMHPAISAFPKRLFYSDQILDAEIVKSRNYEKRYIPGLLFGPYSFIHIPDGREEVDDEVFGLRNMVEAAVVKKLLLLLLKAWRPTKERVSIGVITPYAAQVMAIEGMLGRKFERLDNFTVKVDTVDGFQGAVVDIMLISTVRSNNAEPFCVWNSQKLNVALTRSRKCLWVLGNASTLAKDDSVWDALVCDAKNRKCFFSVHDDGNIGQTILDVKEELDQLDDLLNKESTLFKNSRWKVIFAETFMKSFTKLPSVLMKKYVMTLLVKLSNGWRPKKVTVDPVCQSSTGIVKQFRVQGLYVITTTDIIMESKYVQVMKIWDILPLEAVPKLVGKLDRVYAAFTKEFVRLCKEKFTEGNFEFPIEWSRDDDIVRCRTMSDNPDGRTSTGGKRVVNESLLLLKFYKLSAGMVKHLLSVPNDEALEVPFIVSEKEWEIIHFEGSSFVLGRSGTGKTTVLVMKLFEREQRYHLAVEGSHVLNDGSKYNRPILKPGGRTILRQLFVTFNPKLCYTVKQQISNLQRYVHGEDFETEANGLDLDGIEQFKDIPNSFSEIPCYLYPLVITFKKFLLMLNGTVGESYFNRFPDIIKVCSSGTAIAGRVALQILIEKREVTYDKFRRSYWPHFNDNLIRKLNPLRAFTEIISCIKGGILAEQRDDHYLSLESFLLATDSRKSTFGKGDRDAIYRIFLDYEKLKLKRKEFDLSDLVNDLHRRFKQERYDGDMVDFIYVDEVQDFSMRQISLFRFLCKNSEDGFVFAGDTAQTIARGVDFRFQDIRCLFYTEFLHGVKTVDNKRKSNHKPSPPIFHLSQNFRTHEGILKLADSVIQLIYYFFPNTIDILDPETSPVNGEPPTLVAAGSHENMILELFQINGSCGNTFSFGADQVILVRDEIARKEISNLLGNHALVLTVYECKGLEFKDVLLYDFFGSSSIRDHWNVVYKYMQEKNLGSLFQHYANFNYETHIGLCHELKQLYVAMTRTKERLWICESNLFFQGPMATYWKNLNLVQVMKASTFSAQAIAVASSKGDWRLRGIKFLEVHNYEAAIICFERAGECYWENYARAASLKETASSMHRFETDRAALLMQAAKLFESTDKYKEAAQCYFDAEEYAKAGDIYLKHCKESELDRAGHCFMLAGNYTRAIDIFAKEGLLHECLKACTEGKLFELGLQYIRSWKQLGSTYANPLKANIDLKTTEQQFLQKCAQVAYKNKDKEKFMNYVKDFSSLDSKRSFLKNLGALDELLELEVEFGNFQEALEVARWIGNVLREAEILQITGQYQDAAKIYIWYVLVSRQWANGGKGWPLKTGLAEQLLKAELCANKAPLYLRNKLLMQIKFLSDQKNDLPELQSQLLLSHENENLKLSFLFARRTLDNLVNADVSIFEWRRDLLDLRIHADEKTVQSEVTVESLMYWWNFWKDKILMTLKSMDSPNRSSDKKYWQFCLDYFGVRKRSSRSSSGYFIVYSDAEWVKNTPTKSGGVIKSENLVNAAKDHWYSQLFSVGLRLLDVLSSLESFCKTNLLPVFYRSRILVHLLDCIHFLINLRKPGYVSSTLHGYMDLATEAYHDNVFCLHLRSFFCQATFRKTATTFLRSAVLKQVFSDEQPTHGQLGLVSVLVLALCRQPVSLSKEVLSNLNNNVPWTLFLRELLKSFGVKTESSIDLSLVCHFLDVADAEFNAIVGNQIDVVSPSCFLYLMDRLLIMVSFFKGRIYSTRSCIAEWLNHLDWKVDVSKFEGEDSEPLLFLEAAYEFLAGAVHALLVNEQRLFEWMITFENDSCDFPLLVLRFVVLMCLVCLNSGSYMDLLSDVFNRHEITMHLPQERKLSFQHHS